MGESQGDLARPDDSHKVTDPGLKRVRQAVSVLGAILAIGVYYFTVKNLSGQMVTPLYVLMLVVLIFGFSDKSPVSKFVSRIQLTAWLAFSIMMIPLTLKILEDTNLYQRVAARIDHATEPAPDFKDWVFGGWGFRESVHEELGEFERHRGARSPKNMSCQQGMFVYFIGPEYQFQIRAFINIKKTSDQEEESPSFNVLFHSEASESPKGIALIDLRTKVVKTIKNETEVPMERSLPLVSDKLAPPHTGVAFVNYYPDVVRSKASWFLTPLDGCSGEGKTSIDQYVVVAKNQLKHWHPNKYVYEHVGDPHAPVNFSLATFEWIDGNKEVADPFSLKKLVETMSQSSCASKEDGLTCLGGDPKQRFDTVLKRDFNWNGKLFGNEVAIFKLHSAAELAKTRITAFMIPE